MCLLKTNIVYVENKCLVYCYSRVAQDRERIQVAFVAANLQSLPGTMRMSRALDRIVMNSAVS